MSNVIEQIVARQNQFLEMTETWQKPLISAVTRTAQAVESRASRLPKLPTLPFLSDLPKPSEIWELQFDFASKLMENNRRFIMELAGALEPHEDGEGEKSES